MQWLNYHHLFYFWVTAREGGVARAAAKLRLAHPTVSAQIHALEGALGEKLFTRVGRRLALTEMGKVVLRYADEIFSLGTELVETVKGRPTGRPARLSVGVADVLPKIVARHLLAPALGGVEPVRLVCREDTPERLLAQLAIHELDLILTDAPLPAGTSVRAYSHLLGECPVTFFGTRALCARYRRGFPRSLDGAPLVLPTEGTMLRRSLAHWFDALSIRPRVVAEIEDSALLKVFGQEGLGLFAAPSVVEREVRRQYEVEALGRAEDVRERFYAVSVERRLKHPAIIAITEGARRGIFRESAPASPKPASRKRRSAPVLTEP